MTTQYSHPPSQSSGVPGTGPAARLGPSLSSHVGDLSMRERLPRGRRPRRPALAAAGVLLVVLCGLLSAAFAAANDHRVKVLALARDVQAGQVLSADDLRVAEITGSGVNALGAAGASTVTGQAVTASLPAGTLLNPGMVTSVQLPGAGMQLVAVAVKAGGVPVEAVPGRDVSIVQVVTSANPAAGKGTVAAVLVPKALVVSVRTDASSGAVILTLQVPQAAAVAVAQASASGAVSVTLLPVAP